MLSYVLRRLGVSVVTLGGVCVLVFLLVQLLPGDPARTIAGVLATPEDVQRIREQMSLDDPLTEQLGSYLGDLLRGDLGISARTQRPVTTEIMARLPATLTLAVLATVLGTVGGIVLGVVAATHRGRITDYVLSMFAVTGVSMPVYWLGLLLIIVFAVNLGWVPPSGADTAGAIVLPAVTLGMFSLALVSRMTRASMLEALGEDYVRTAHAKGAGRRRVVYRHGLRNAFIPVLTVIGLQFGQLLGGAVLTESVFAWPGLGRLLVDSIFARDFPVVQGVILLFAAMFILLNLIVDVLYATVDPRVSYTT